MPTPDQKPTPSRPAAMTTCQCGARVLIGETRTGVPVTVELGIPTYVVIWGNGEPVPQLRESGGYPVHRCPDRDEHIE
jgi:hypothetical protein